MKQKIYEWCSSCGTEQEVTEFGGICAECEKFIKPCSQCNMDKISCSSCPYIDSETVKIKDNEFSIVEIDTIYNKYLQIMTTNIRDYETYKTEYTINEFINDLQSDLLDIKIKVFYSLVDIVQYVYVDDLSNNGIAENIIVLMQQSKNGAVSITDENNVIVFDEYTSKEKYILLEDI